MSGPVDDIVIDPPGEYDGEDALLDVDHPLNVYPVRDGSEDEIVNVCDVLVPMYD